MTHNLIVFDLETGGVADHHPDIQLAAIALDPHFEELEAFERKIRFAEAEADPEALTLNHYSPDVWVAEAKPLGQVISEFSEFLKRHATVQMVSKRTGAPYSVALLAGYNAATFDGPRLQRMYAQAFLPAHPRVLCVLQRVLWFSQETGFKPTDYKLSTVAHELGCVVDGAHDALFDVRMTISVMKALKGQAVLA